jgi:hypothetical protein
VAGGNALTRLLDAFAAACYRLRRSVIARWATIALAILALGLALFSRPGQVENQSVRDAGLGSISSASIDTYVRVTGFFDPSGAYRTSYNLGGIELYGGRYVPLVSPDLSDAVYVIDDGLPRSTPGQPVTIVAQVMAGQGAQPPLYLQMGYPPNVVLANTLARAGTLLLALVLLAVFVVWLVERFDYAIPLPWQVKTPPTPAPTLMWYGDLGRQYNDTVLRSHPAEFNATPHEARFASADPKGLWQVSIKRLKSVQLFDVASKYGALPAARLRFEDERGLLRHAVIAANSPTSRSAVLEVLSLIR